MAARFITSATKPADFPKDGVPEVAVVGRSNVGKSSLLNRILGERGLAFVSKTPGRTQWINFYRVDERFHLVDLPGYGFARAPVAVRRRWEGLVTAYLFERSELCLALLLVDARRDPMPIDETVRDLLAESGTPYVVIATKSDKLSRSALIRQRAKLAETFGAAGEVPVIAFSAVTNQGRNELWNVIQKHVQEAKRAWRTRSRNG